MSFISRPSDRLAAERLGQDRILVVAEAGQALDLLRWATIRSDEVVFVAHSIDPAARRYADRFAIETHHRAFHSDDLAEASAVLVSLTDREEENRIVRSARRHRVGVHVVGRPLVSDFTVLALLEQQPLRALAA